jgi:hypothetical protein
MPRWEDWGMRVSRWFEFFRTAGLLGGGSVIFALVLFAIAVWEHYKDKNVPASWLVACGVLFFGIGLYQAWSKERDEKEAAQARIESPNFEFSVGTIIWRYDPQTQLSVFFVLASILNKGHRSIARNWNAEYRIGLAKEQMKSFFLREPYIIPIGDEQITFENGDLLNVRASQNAIERGDMGEGRLLFTLPGDRTHQIAGLQYSIEYSCEDYQGKVYRAVYRPSPEPVPKLVTFAHERAKKIPTPPG